MESRYEETAIVVNKGAPVPPPLPSPSSTTAIYQQKGFGMSTNRSSSMRRSCCVSAVMRGSWDQLFDEAYRADVSIHTDGDTIIYAHSNVLGSASSVFRSMFKQSSKRKGLFSVPIRGVPPEAVRIFIRFLYSSCYEEEEIKEHILSLLVLSHAFAVPQCKRECEYQLEHKLLNLDNVVDVFQLALLCDAPRLGIFCHRLILKSFKAVSSSEAWQAMKKSHPILEKEVLESVADEDNMQKERVKKLKEREIYLQLYEAMEALVHICRDGCRTIGPHDKVLKEDQEPCNYEACKGLESLIRHFAGCKLRVPGGCVHCKRMWQLLELHSRLCANSNTCRVPLCRNFKEKTTKQKKKDDIMWRILVRKIVRTKSITGAPFFSLAASS